MTLQALSAEKREAVRHDCEIVVRLANEVFKRLIRYDEASIKWLAWLIEFSRNKPNEQVKKNLQTSIGCFLGEAIIARYGGEWVVTETGEMGVRLPSKTVVFPFLKVSKQFKNGEGDSIWGTFKTGELLQQNSQPDAPPNCGPVTSVTSSGENNGPQWVS